MGDRLVELPTAGQSVAEVVVGIGVVWLAFQRLPVLRDGCVKLSAVRQVRPRL